MVLLLGLAITFFAKDVSPKGEDDTRFQAQPTRAEKGGAKALSTDTPKTEIMVASWYGEPFHGRLTANGEKYDMNKISAAHKFLPFGTKLRLTNPLNGHSIELKINDRGPYILGRDLDLSLGAAFELGFVYQGLARLVVEVVEQPAQKHSPI